MSPTKKVTVKIDLRAKRKRLAHDLNARARCLCCHLPLLSWGDHALLDELTTCGLYDGTDYMMCSKIRVLCEHCDDESRVLEALRGATELPLAAWQELFKHAVRLCVKGMRLD
jgi:hypothetical protein